MKRRIWLVLLGGLLLSLMVALLANAAGVQTLATLLDENFDYGGTAGNLTAVSGGQWTAHSGAGALPVQYAVTGLSLPAYASSGVGGSATFANGSGSREDVNRIFGSETTGVLYYAVLVKVSAADGTENYFMHLKDATTSGFRARLFAKDVNGHLRFGISSAGGTGSYGAVDFGYNTTYLVVVKYDVGGGASALYVLDTCRGTEPALPLQTSTGAALTPITSIAIRQAGGALAGTIDGIRVARTWAEAAQCGAAETLNKSASPNAGVDLDGEVTYAITLTNVGGEDDSDVLFTDTLPAKVDFARWVYQPDGATLSDGEITWSGSLSASEAISFTFVVTNTGDYGDVVTNTAEFSGTNNAGTAEGVFSVRSPTTFVYHDLEDVVRAGDQVYLVGDFNYWSTTATPMVADATDETFTAVVSEVVVGNTYEYKYLVKSGGADQWEWLQASGDANNRSVTVAVDQIVNDYRDVAVGWAILQYPASMNADAFVPTDPVYGRVYIEHVTNPNDVPGGEGRGIKAEVGYGQATDPAAWTWFPMTFNVDDGNNDEFMGTMLPTAGGVFSYAVRFDGNWGPGNPNAEWVYADTDGYIPDFNPFELSFTGRMTVTMYDVEVTKTAEPAEVFVADDAGALVTYTIAVHNRSTDEAASTVLLTDQLPEGFVYVSDICPVEPQTTDPVVWNLTDPILAGQGVTCTLVVSATDAITRTGLYTNTASIAATPADENPANDTDTAGVTVNRIISIHDIQYVADPVADDGSAYEGQVVWTEGVVVARTDEIGNNNAQFVIEDPAAGPWSGLLIYNYGAFPDVEEGDYVQVMGQIQEYFGMTEMSIRYAPHDLRVVRSGDPLPAPEVIPTGDFSTVGTAEPWESVLIRFEDAVVTDEDVGFGEWTFDDGSGNTTGDDWGEIDGNMTYVPALGDHYCFIQGIGFYTYNVWALEPRYNADINVCWPDLDNSSKVSNHAGQQVRPGELVTYTITLTNTGTADAAATVVDSLPGFYTVHDAGDFTNAPEGTLTWTGQVPAGGHIHLQFVVQVAALADFPVGVTPLANSVLIDDGITSPYYVADILPPQMVKYALYLPVVARRP